MFCVEKFVKGVPRQLYQPRASFYKDAAIFYCLNKNTKVENYCYQKKTLKPVITSQETAITF